MDDRHAAAGSAARLVRKHKASASASLPVPRAQTHVKRSLSFRRQAHQPGLSTFDSQDVPSRPKSTPGHRRGPTTTSIPVPRRQESRTLLTPIGPSQGVDEMPLWNSPSNSGAGPASARHGRTGGFSSVFKKMFNRRSRDGPGRQSATSNLPMPHHVYHQNESYAIPVVHTPTVEEDDFQPPMIAPARPARSIEESIPDRAPRRLPFPMNINARQASAHTQRPKTSGSNRSVQRRATMSSADHGAGPDEDQAELQPPHRAEVNPGLERSDTEQRIGYLPGIGMAITSDVKGRDRRSKSAGDLFRLAQDEAAEGQGRRRSEEIEYWRQGFTPSSAENVPRFILHDGTLPSNSGIEVKESDAMGNQAQHQHARESVRVERYASDDLDDTLARPSLITELSEPFTPVFDRLSLLENDMQDITATLQGLAGRAYQTTMMQVSPQSTRTRNTNLEESMSSPARIGLPANPRDTLANRRSRQTLQDTSGQNQASPSQPRKDSFLPSPNPDGMNRMIDSQFATHPLTTPHRERPISSFSPQSLNLSPSKSSPHLRGASKPSAKSAPTVDEMSEGVAGDDEVITTASIYTHLAPIYSALRYERQQRKNLEAQVDILAKQVGDLALLLHRQSHQSLSLRERNMASPLLVQSMSHQQIASTRSPRLVQISSPRTVTTHSLDPEISTRCDAPSSSIYHAPSERSIERLATFYPHFPKDSTIAPDHNRSGPYQQQVEESRWSGYSDRTQSSSLIGEQDDDFQDVIQMGQTEQHTQVLQRQTEQPTTRPEPFHSPSREQPSTNAPTYCPSANPTPQKPASRIPRSSPPRPGPSSSALSSHKVSSTPLVNPSSRRKVSPTSTASPTPKKPSPPLKKKSPEARLREMSNRSIRPPTPPRPRSRSRVGESSVQGQVQARTRDQSQASDQDHGKGTAPSTLNSPFEYWTPPLEEYSSAPGSPMREERGTPVPLVIGGMLDFGGCREGESRLQDWSERETDVDGNVNVSGNVGNGGRMQEVEREEQGWVHADNLRALSWSAAGVDEDEIF